jgi:hypothetical protein
VEDISELEAAGLPDGLDKLIIGVELLVPGVVFEGVGLEEGDERDNPGESPRASICLPWATSVEERMVRSVKQVNKDGFMFY